MEIRLMNIADYPLVYQLWTGTKGMGMRSLDDSEEGIAKFLLRNPNTSFVACEDDRLIGTILCGHDGRRGYIYHMMITQTNRNKGTGKLLVEAACDALREEGIHKSALVVYSYNELGNAFWQSLGWEKREDLNYYNFSLNNDNF